MQIILGSEVRRSFRRLARSRGFSIVVVLLLSIGIGANTIIFTVVNALLLRTLPSRPRPMVTPDRYSAAVTGVCSGQERRAFLKFFYLRVAYGDILILKMHKPPMPAGVTK